MEELPDIDEHLKEALSHLEQAIEQSVRMIVREPAAQKELARAWELFLGDFLGSVREKGKQYGVNLFNLISFPRLRR
ncbi:hypothetical protein CEB3_c27440 [Peptococcaceae bacterium CEB3]|nr:hypothetical protein CEB3_c27440 [Peptococcaceae bacterium CEB3]